LDPDRPPQLGVGLGQCGRDAGERGELQTTYPPLLLTPYPPPPTI
jgi:hypothetical protein